MDMTGMNRREKERVRVRVRVTKTETCKTVGLELMRVEKITG